MTDLGELEYEGVSEELGEAVSKTHPIVDKARGEIFNMDIKEGYTDAEGKLQAAVRSERKRRLRSHGLDVFELLYRSTIGRARAEALADNKTPKDLKRKIRECIKEEKNGRGEFKRKRRRPHD